MLDRIRDAFSAGGIKGILYNAYALAFDQWYDVKHGTDTNHLIKLERLTIESENRKLGRSYQATRTIPLQKLFTKIEPFLPEERVLVDLGSGKGRVLLIASRFHFREVRGIEFASELCQIARKNCEIFKKASRTRTVFSVIESDVLDYTFRRDENVFFFYNSFEEPVLKVVLAKISASLKTWPRRILLICYNPQFRHFIDRQGGFARVLDFQLHEYRFLVYSNEAFRPQH